MHRAILLVPTVLAVAWSVGASCESDSRLPPFADLAADGSFRLVEQGEALGGQVADEPSFVLYAGDASFDAVTSSLIRQFDAEGWEQRQVLSGESDTVAVFGDSSESLCVSYSDMTAPNPFIPKPLTLKTVDEAKQEHASVILMILFDCQAL